MDFYEWRQIAHMKGTLQESWESWRFTLGGSVGAVGCAEGVVDIEVCVGGQLLSIAGVVLGLLLVEPHILQHQHLRACAAAQLAHAHQHCRAHAAQGERMLPSLSDMPLYHVPLSSCCCLTEGMVEDALQEVGYVTELHSKRGRGAIHLAIAQSLGGLGDGGPDRVVHLGHLGPAQQLLQARHHRVQAELVLWAVLRPPLPRTQRLSAPDNPGTASLIFSAPLTPLMQHL